MSSDTTTRLEHDSLGEMAIPANAYYGIQTKRALDNFHISGVGINHYPNLIRAFGMVKKACAAANKKLGYLEPEKYKAIAKACDELIDGKLHEWFSIDVFQGGAGTSTNMNANEVIANRGLELMGYHKGEYQHLHPNDDVNLSQSTNDVYPTAVRLAVLLSHTELMRALDGLAYEFRQRGVEFADIIKLGRTQLQDAVPMTLGQEFEAFAINIKEDVARGDEIVKLFREVNLGGTAVGTGINTEPEYSNLAIEELTRISGIEMVRAANLIEASWDMGAFVLYSAMRLMRCIAALYGGRPGTLGFLRLAGNVLSHLTLTSGIAMGDSLLQQVMGLGLAARVSAKLGEGVVNGLLTARVGLSAIAVCRPLPFTVLDPPVLGDVASSLFDRSAAKPPETP